MREGRLPLAEFLSAVRALRDGTWRLPAVRAICPAEAVCYLADTLTADTEPWLVPGFTEGAENGDRAGELVRTRCLDANRPLGADAEDRNRSLARANPLPDGQDGARWCAHRQSTHLRVGEGDHRL